MNATADCTAEYACGGCELSEAQLSGDDAAECSYNMVPMNFHKQN